jgi:hypothetical protein
MQPPFIVVDKHAGGDLGNEKHCMAFTSTNQ